MFFRYKESRQVSKIKHELIDVLVLCVLGFICGAEGLQDIEEVGHDRLSWLQERVFLKIACLSMTQSQNACRGYRPPNNVACGLPQQIN